jgi:hypothetical protein
MMMGDGWSFERLVCGVRGVPSTSFGLIAKNDGVIWCCEVMMILCDGAMKEEVHGGTNERNGDNFAPQQMNRKRDWERRIHEAPK